MASTSDMHYSVVGQNNRNLLVQSKKVAPYHEDITRITPFEKDNIAPGSWATINLDFKHAMDREIVLNDIRLRFKLDLSARSAAGAVGRVYCVRATDLIQQLIVKINNDTVFEVTKSKELSFLWEMNNHRTLGEPHRGDSSFLLNHGVLPKGNPPNFEYDIATKNWYTQRTQAAAGTDTFSNAAFATAAEITVVGEERHDGIPRLIFDDGENPDYVFTFDVSLNQLVGPIFHRLHVRRVEHVQIDLLFEPYVSPASTQEFLLFAKDPTVGGTLTHPYQLARYTNLEIRQYRSVLLDGVHGFTLPSTKMLSWLMHRYSRREYSFNLDTMTHIDIPLKDWEIRTNITRVLWMWAPEHYMGADANYFYPLGAPGDYDALAGVEILWKNDKVLDLDTTYEVYRHYILSENKRYGFDDPFIRFARLTSTVGHRNQAMVKPPVNVAVTSPAGDPTYPDNDRLLVDGEIEGYIWQDGRGYKLGHDGTPVPDPRIGKRRYEFPVYHVDLNMNIQHGVPGAEIIGGIVNDTNDYVIRLKRLSDRPAFDKTYATSATRTLWVFLEYQTLVNLSAGSNHFNRGSQVITKQLNPQS